MPGAFRSHVWLLNLGHGGDGEIKDDQRILFTELEQRGFNESDCCPICETMMLRAEGAGAECRS